MTPYEIAWAVVVASGVALGVLVFRALRGYQWLRYTATALVVAWAVTPYQFDGEHTAPAFLVAAFRLPFVDADADPAEAVLTLASVTVGVLLAALLLMIGRAVIRRFGR